MPGSPSSSSSDLARIRDNQRRSRARRKEHIQHLENRVLTLERLRVQASVEMQKAARKVAIENERLRSLLKRRGMTEIDIDEHLQGENAVSPERDLPKRTKHLQSSPQLGVGPDYQRSNTPFEFSSPLARHAVEQILSNPRISLPTQDVRIDSPSNQAPEFSDVVTPRSDSQHLGDLRPQNGDTILRRTDNETDCVVAATIITGMRGSSDIEEVRAELGCSPDADCQVGNVTLFQIMDR